MDSCFELETDVRIITGSSSDHQKCDEMLFGSRFPPRIRTLDPYSSSNSPLPRLQKSSRLLVEIAAEVNNISY
jgi:hypothetical protein